MKPSLYKIYDTLLRKADRENRPDTAQWARFMRDRQSSSAADRLRDMFRAAGLEP